MEWAGKNCLSSNRNTYKITININSSGHSDAGGMTARVRSIDYLIWKPFLICRIGGTIGIAHLYTHKAASGKVALQINNWNAFL